MSTLTRVAKTAAATLEHTFYVGETPTDSTTTVTATITDANGDPVTSGNATSAGDGRYTFALPGQAALKLCSVAWAGTIALASVVETDYAEVVGGFFFSLFKGRASDASLNDRNKYPLADLELARTETEVECEYICEQAFVPRYRRVVLDGSGTSDLVLPDWDVRAIRSAKVATAVDETFVALTAAELAALAVRSDQVLRRTDGNTWYEGDRNVVVEYEFGLDAPPVDIVRAALVRFRSRLNIHRSGIPDRATSFTTFEGGTYRIALPEEFRTGIPEVDAAYGRHSRRSTDDNGDGRGVPASRTLNFDPQHYSLFHRGVR